MSKITQVELKRRVHYDPISGIFTRLTTYHNFKTGDVMGHENTKGYVCIKLSIEGLGTTYKAHRLAFLYMVGVIPNQVDHDNQIRNDNRWENLNNATALSNARNKSICKNNTSGATGVSKYTNKTGIKWRARIGDGNGGQLDLGVFDSFDEAITVRDQAEADLKYHKNHGKLKSCYI